ncbi:46 kDa FK506-binding nuclear protein [Topomyia yanbarensis]|uniref:46 kDa FK506-binding nuclear protein n=1 Tax=Topomyia yanbarensis TaxID=2498891 RepID=UPI00273B83FD|nr:46 kDa FK506-binding nuclear protein [Topomyia yanbarensis]
MFWGLILKANKKYSQTVVKSFHLSQAALDLSKGGDDVQVMLTSEENTYLLCTLSKKTPQVALDLNFMEGDQISLSTNGEGIVHLTGYLVPEEEDLFGGEEEDEEEVEDEELEVQQQLKSKGGKERAAKKVAQKVIKNEVQKQKDGDEDDELDETFELPKGAQKKPAGADSDESDSDDDEDEEEDDDEDEDMDDSKTGPQAEEKDSESDDDEEEDDSDDDDSDESEDEQPAPKVAKLEKKPSKQNGLENGKASSKELKKDEKQQQKEESKVRTLQGGLVVEDLKVGNGPEAKPGKKVVVYYEGRLKKNNKVFDSTSKGPGFKFALGRGEVIKGWDLGVTGMKVGGKRRLTVPHQLAYGTKGSPPVIPPNSTLVFDVELKNVH